LSYAFYVKNQISSYWWLSYWSFRLSIVLNTIQPPLLSHILVKAVLSTPHLSFLQLRDLKFHDKSHFHYLNYSGNQIDLILWWFLKFVSFNFKGINWTLDCWFHLAKLICFHLQISMSENLIYWIWTVL